MMRLKSAIIIIIIAVSISVFGISVCASIHHESPNLDRDRFYSDGEIFENSQLLQYIQERRLRNIEELERLGHLELLAKERVMLQGAESRRDYQNENRRLQEESLFDYPVPMEEEPEEEGDIEGLTARRSRNGNDYYFPRGVSNNRPATPRYQRNPLDNNNRISGYPNSNYYGSGNNQYHNYNTPRPYPNGFNPASDYYDYNNRWRGSPNPQAICCQDCRSGDVNCLSNCQRICVQSQKCNKAGVGAYAAFCQQACPNSAIGLTLGRQYLPIKACEGECAAQVQELCNAHSCRDYGCFASDCAIRAPLKCRLA